MALGLRLRVTNTRDNTVFERTFDRFPVRIGRNPLNDFQIDQPFVSQYHAVLELRGNALMLRDLGSKNGTALRTTGRVPPNQLVDLSTSHFEFAIVSLVFQASPVNVVPTAAQQRKRAGTVLSSMIGNETMMVGAEQRPQPGAPSPQDALLTLEAQLKPLYHAYRGAWGQLYRSLYSSLGSLDPLARMELFKRLTTAFPSMATESDFQQLAAHFGAPVARPNAAQSAENNEAAVALQGLKELASWYLPQARPLEGVGDIANFLGKLQDTLDVFFKCFVPLRDGYKQFESQMDLKNRKTMRSGGYAQPPARSVETARDQRELASCLLDWNDPNTEGPRLVESTFADLMIHQVAMLNGVMMGVKSLLHELAPKTLEQEYQERRQRKTGDFSFFTSYHKALWQLYEQRHGDLADEEKETFALIFGPEFVQAYRQLAGEAAGPATNLPSAYGQVPAVAPGPKPPTGPHSSLVASGTPAVTGPRLNPELPFDPNRR